MRNKRVDNLQKQVKSQRDSPSRTDEKKIEKTRNQKLNRAKLNTAGHT